MLYKLLDAVHLSVHSQLFKALLPYSEGQHFFGIKIKKVSYTEEPEEPAK